ncbi:MAG: ACT domain-containing protein [Erysipelotrichaceae bacterium]|nr:ACT domain-containing protein [Erysipelotrichaceae bacterium]
MPDEYLIVHKAILPDYYDRVIQAREDLNDKKYLSVQDACKANNISRSTFYKYKDYLYRLKEKDEGKKCVLSLTVNDEKGVLSEICNRLSSLDVSIQTISQAPPIDKKASLLISADITNMPFSVSTLLKKLKEIEQVCQVELLSFS